LRAVQAGIARFNGADEAAEGIAGMALLREGESEIRTSWMAVHIPLVRPPTDEVRYALGQTKLLGGVPGFAQEDFEGHG
jgi:hypothetical protein